MGGLFLLNVGTIFLSEQLLACGSIWRLYVVWNCKWILAFVMLTLEAAHFAILMHDLIGRVSIVRIHFFLSREGGYAGICSD
ncbi:hypothetical protein BDR03DRAFT_974364 [Suillus americanus]|nr:hypothetical protein BDR03DRAFT_974364 [Suillus americanus]